MPEYLIADAVLNFPGPSIEQVVAQVLAHYQSRRSVATSIVAQSLGADARIVEDRLNQAMHCRLVLHVHGKGWIPPAT